MKRGVGSYSEEFRLEAVRLVESGKPLKQIARDLGVSVMTLRAWRRRLGKRPEGSARSMGTVPLLEEENRRLRRENARLLEEREILKKATAFFAKDAR
jgi:transposase